MSLKTWKEEFYPVSALKAIKSGNMVDWVLHALVKWQGLKPKNLEKHELTIISYVGIEDDDGNILQIDSSTCSLCRKFDHYSPNCNGCPLYESRNKVRCFEYSPNETTPDSPYGMWIDDNDPAPMIRALRKALKWAKEHS